MWARPARSAPSCVGINLLRDIGMAFSPGRSGRLTGGQVVTGGAMRGTADSADKPMVCLGFHAAIEARPAAEGRIAQSV